MDDRSVNESVRNFEIFSISTEIEKIRGEESFLQGLNRKKLVSQKTNAKYCNFNKNLNPNLIFKWDRF